MGHRVRVVTSDTGDIQFLFGENLAIRIQAGLERMSIVRRVAARAKGVVGVAPYAGHVSILVPDLQQIVGIVQFTFGQNLAHRRVTLPAYPGRRIFDNVGLFQ